MSYHQYVCEIVEAALEKAAEILCVTAEFNHGIETQVVTFENGCSMRIYFHEVEPPQEPPAEHRGV